MCTRFVYRGSNLITGFNFDIDLAVWKHKILLEKDRFCIGILRPDGAYHAYHGVHRSGNAGTLLYVHGNPEGAYKSAPECITIADLTEQFIQAKLSLEEVLRIVRTKKVVYAPDSTMQAMLSDARGRTLVIEPGNGYREEKGRYALITNYSLLNPKSTAPFLVPGDDRFQRAQQLLDGFGEDFSVSDAFSVLRAVRQEGLWASRVSFVYSAQEQRVYYVENNHFERIAQHDFAVK